ncbi:MAG: hypothetical protein K0S65_6373 [Labilithrix sp.]|nr:hypothetical protein [Labilithrix sp.]
MYVRPVFAFTVSTTLAVALTHCGNASERAEPQPANDATIDAFDDMAATDASSSDAGDAHVDFDASPRAVVCGEGPCATSLTSVVSETFCALLADETVACWGENRNGQTGRGSDASLYAKPKPERVVGLERVVSLQRNCAIDRDGSTWCWGRAAYVADEAAVPEVELAPVKLPIPPASQIAPTNYLSDDGLEATTCALVDGKLVCWGTNADGQIAVPVPGNAPEAMPPHTIELPAGAPIRAMALGRATLLLREDGTLLTWGSHPALGRSSSLSPDPYPRQVLLTGVTAFDVTDRSACAVAGGVGYCWGPPFYPNAPYNEPPLTRALPTPIATPEPLVGIATSISSFPERGCGIGVSGDVYCWGSNAFGQAGDGTTDALSPSAPPVKVVGLPAPAASVRTTPLATCALLTTGKVYCWGDNRDGQLGIGALGSITPKPVEAHLP